MRDVRKQSRGHNLLEAIIASFVFLIMVVFSSGLWITYSRAIVNSRDRLVATHLAKNVLENVVDLGFDSARSEGPFVLTVELETDGVAVEIPYTYSTVVTLQESGLKRVLVQVAYEFKDKVSEVELETLLAFR